MKLSILSAILLYCNVSVLATVVPRQAPEPCAAVSIAVRDYKARMPGSTPRIAADLAYACLVSVPLNAPAATLLVNSMLPYVSWQSSLSYLAAPPAGYQFPAVNVTASLNTILSNIDQGLYANEHAFQTDLLMLFQSVHDGHFRFAPDLLTKALHFRRPLGVVSVSLDGVEVPKVYTRDSIDEYIIKNKTTTPLPIISVNGEPVQIFMAKLASLGLLQDLDGLYNNLMYEMAFDAQFPNVGYQGYFALAGRYGYFYPGANTTFEVEGGIVTTISNYAEAVGNFDGVVDGKTMYQRFCTGPGVDAKNISHAHKPPLPPTVKSPAHRYPIPQVISTDKQVSGYFLDGDGYEDVAVLSILSFAPKRPIEFQNVIQTMISDAKAAGKTKLVIDLSSNAGGTVVTGYDAFRQLFPSIVQDGFSRLRQHDAFKVMSTGISRYAANFSTASNNSKEYFAYGSVLNYQYDLNLTDDKFASYDEKFGPVEVNGDKYTNLMRWNLNDQIMTNEFWGVGETITGYGSRQNFTQPFAAENIIMVYDGSCASTCTLFSDFMRVQAGVKSIAMGGRPNTSPIQGVGGTRGANTYQYEHIRMLSMVALEAATPDERADWTKTINYTNLPQNRSTDCSINSRDNILRSHIKDGIPAQFLYEPADCRLFYEPLMLSDVTAIWKRAADAAWGAKKCVAGSLKQKNESREERMRRSEEMKVRAENEGRAPLKQRAVDEMMLEPPMNYAFGKKIPL